MNKVLIEVRVPLIEKSFDMFIPINKKIAQVTMLISQAINEITDGVYIVKHNTILCNSNTGEVYNTDVLVKDSGLINGSKVLLI